LNANESVILNFFYITKKDFLKYKNQYGK